MARPEHPHTDCNSEASATSGHFRPVTRWGQFWQVVVPLKGLRLLNFPQTGALTVRLETTLLIRSVGQR